MPACAWPRASTAALNQFIEIPGEGLFPTPDNKYRVCWYRFGHDQLFFVRGKLPAARYFSFALYNVWLESLDYKHRPVKLNHSQIVCDAETSAQQLREQFVQVMYDREWKARG